MLHANALQVHFLPEHVHHIYIAHMILSQVSPLGRLTAPKPVASCARQHARLCRQRPLALIDVRSRASATEAKVYEVAMPELPAPASGKFMPEFTSFSEEHRIRGYEAGPDQRATIVAMANLLQVCARISNIIRF